MRIEATLLRNEAAAPGHQLLTFDCVPSDYERPGQYVMAWTRADKPGHFAIASSPGEPLQLLIKAQGTECVADDCCAVQPRQVVSISAAQGAGFPLERVAGRPLVVLCTGSGIAAVRPVVHAEVAAGLPRPVHFYCGVPNEELLCFADEIETWRDHGVSTSVCVSRDPSWQGHHGYVQDAALYDGVVTGDAGLVMSGREPMMRSAKALFAAADCPAEHMLTNY